jgi:hypothetical protein
MNVGFFFKITAKESCTGEELLIDNYHPKITVRFKDSCKMTRLCTVHKLPLQKYAPRKNYYEVDNGMFRGLHRQATK